LLAQGDIDPQDRLFWRNERSFGFALNTDGWSVIYRELRQTKPSGRVFFEGSFEGFKHPKEIKLTNYYFQNSGSFVYGKLNSTWSIGAGIGYQKELFEKRDLGGVSIGWLIGGGPTLLFAKPIYYEVIVPSGDGYYEIEEQKFDITKIHQALDIVGKASFFKGFDEIQLIPGLVARTGFNFEYSKNDKLTHAIEVGAIFHAFTKEVPIMANEDNRQFLPGLFVSYRIGMILDPLKPSRFSDLIFRPNKE
jgi:hypothetical protein